MRVENKSNKEKKMIFQKTLNLEEVSFITTCLKKDDA
jgi:hypothetical protein